MGNSSIVDFEVIGIRADANEEVAMGHIMRCITIAGQLKKLGKRICFFTADEYAAELLERAGMEHVCLHSEWNHMEDEVSVFKKALKERGCKKLLVDSYYAGTKYFEQLADLCKLIYIDDCFEDIYPVDMLINYNAYHIRFNYEEAYKKTYPGRTKLLLGTSYVPLREEFQGQGDAGYSMEVDSLLNKLTKQVLLSSGGGDAYNALSGILNEAVKDNEFDSIIFHTVVGRFNPNVEELKQLAGSHTNIKLHYDVKNMAALMKNCDAAVSAAGTVLYELSAMQVPSVFFVIADNQQYDSEFFVKEERMLFAGDIRSDRDHCIGNICSGIKKILGDDALCQRMKKALCEVTDGKGAERIARAIISL
ncbi:MAG: UDP-2,4-diacetamido-2,4,6-trideoxy-beta-L-altropyranose hydrolase [Lachnospiraceae bacterium]|nr:UDP-2,4-diacetamido-2,4,6-trideoxy-beta-L-altropyranose hydrolase [Lachnospiraceae bacterium]